MLGSTPPPTYKKAVPHLADTVDRWAIFDFHAPSLVIQWTGAIDANTGAYDRGKRVGGISIRVLHALTPETETSCHYFWSCQNGYGHDDPATTTILFGQIAEAFAEDKRIVQLQQQSLNRFGSDGLVNIVWDGARVHMRRVVDRLAAAEDPSLPVAELT
jgi:hypothetical protein